MPSDRRRLDEVVTLYDVEPPISGDIYVEGPFDKRLLEWLFHCVGRPRNNIYEIDTVDVPDDVVENFGLPTGSNRSRVIALARTLAQAIPSIADRVAFAIDRDLDDYFGTTWTCPSLFSTDYTSLDVYLFEESVIERYLFFAIRTSGLRVGRFMESLATLLTELFLIRLTNASLSMNLRRVGFERSCSVTADGYLILDTNNYLCRYLGANGQTKRLEEFKGEMAQQKECLPSDPRLRMHGHDLKNALYHFSQESRGARVFNSEASLEAALLMALDAEKLLQREFISNILQWARTSSIL